MEWLSIEVLKTFGLPTAIVVFTLWRDYTREQRMTKQIDDLQRWMRMEMLSALHSSSRLHDMLVGEMTKRPCLKDIEKKERKDA